VLVVDERFQRRMTVHSIDRIIRSSYKEEKISRSESVWKLHELTKKHETFAISTPQTCSITSKGNIFVPSSIPLLTKIKSGKGFIAGKSSEASVTRIEPVGTANMITSHVETNSFPGAEGPRARIFLEKT
jgi:hypothetical protein